MQCTMNSFTSLTVGLQNILSNGCIIIYFQFPYFSDSQRTGSLSERTSRQGAALCRAGGRLSLHPRQQDDDRFLILPSKRHNASSLRLQSAGLNYSRGRTYFQGPFIFLPRHFSTQAARVLLMAQLAKSLPAAHHGGRRRQRMLLLGQVRLFPKFHQKGRF